MDKQEYLKIRSKLLVRNIDDDAYRLYHEYWANNKAEEYITLDFEEFKKLFQIYLEQPGNYEVTTNKILNYFDSKIGVTYVKDKNLQLLTIC